MLVLRLTRQAFEEAVGRDIVELTGIAQQGRRRREEQQVVEALPSRLELGGQGLEVEAAAHLGLQHPGDGFLVHAVDQAIVEHHRGMDDALERPAGGQALDRALQGAGVGDVEGDRSYIDASAAERLDAGAGPVGQLAGAARQHEMPGAAGGQPFSGGEAEAAGAADHQVDAVRSDGEGAGRSRILAGLAGRRDHDLADMAGALHQPEGVAQPLAAEHAMRQGLEFAGREQLNQFAEQALRELAMVDDQLVDVDAEVAEVAAERPQADMSVGVEIALAELDEPAERPQAVERADHRFAGQRIQHDVDAAALGVGGNLVGEGERARIQHQVGAEIAQHRALFLRAGRGNDLGTAEARDLQGREPHRAGAAMDQHSLAFFQARQMHQRVVGGEEGDGQGGGRLEGEVARQRAHREGRGHDVAGKAAGHEGDDAVADLVFERLGPDGAHDAGAFHAQRRTGIAVFQRFFRQEA